MGVGNKKNRLFETLALMAMRANLKLFLNDQPKFEKNQMKYVQLAQRVLLDGFSRSSIKVVFRMRWHAWLILFWYGTSATWTCLGVVQLPNVLVNDDRAGYTKWGKHFL